MSNVHFSLSTCEQPNLEQKLEKFLLILVSYEKYELLHDRSLNTKNLLKQSEIKKQFSSRIHVEIVLKVLLSNKFVKENMSAFDLF